METQTLGQSLSLNRNVTTMDKPLVHLNQDAESIYIGLLQLTGKIIDNFDIRLCEQVVEQKQLIDDCLLYTSPSPRDRC